VSKAVENFWDYGENVQVYRSTRTPAQVVELAAEKSEWGRKLPHATVSASPRIAALSLMLQPWSKRRWTRRAICRYRGSMLPSTAALRQSRRIRSRSRGAVIMGIGLAMKTQITFKDGKVMQSNFDDYEVTRMPEMPGMTNVHITPANYALPPGGIGEPGVPPIAQR